MDDGLGDTLETTMNDIAEKVRECVMAGNSSAAEDYAAALRDTASAWQTVMETEAAE